MTVPDRMRILLSIACSCWVAITACASTLGPTPDYFNPSPLTGSIFDKEGGRLLFTFRRAATRTNHAIHVLREFRNPDGSLAARERVVYEQGRLARFDLDELQIGADGRAVVEPQRIEFQYTKGSDAKPRRN